MPPAPWNDCTECGQPHPRGCHEHVPVRDEDGRRVLDDTGRSLIDRPCAQFKMRDQIVCKMHGGRAPQNRAAAERRGVENDARRTLGRLNIVAVDNPLEELSKLAGEIVAWKDMLGAKVAELADLTSGDEGGSAALPDADRVRAEIVLFERGLDRCVTVLGQIARLNIDERLTTIRETQLRQVSDALTMAMRDAGMDTSKQREVVGSLGRHLRVAAG